MCVNVDGSLVWAFIMKHGFVACFGFVCLGVCVVESGLLSNFLPPNGSIDVILGGKVNDKMIVTRSFSEKGCYIPPILVGMYTFRRFQSNF